MTDLLKQKIEHSIQLLKKAEKLAIRYDSEDGFFLAFRAERIVRHSII